MTITCTLPHSGKYLYEPSAQHFVDQPVHCTALIILEMTNYPSTLFIIVTMEKVQESDRGTLTTNTSPKPVSQHALSECLAHSDLLPNQRQLMHTILREISGVLGSSIADLTSNSLVQHYINSSNAKPIKQTVYHACHHHRQEIEKQVEEMPRNGIIEASISPWASPVLLVTKAHDTLQLCIDYRNLNKTTIKDCYRLPHIEDTLAFTTHIGLLQYIRLTFGLANAPASFQRLLEYVLQDYIGKFVFRYIEDILIFSATFEDHLSHVAQVLQTH